MMVFLGGVLCIMARACRAGFPVKTSLKIRSSDTDSSLSSQYTSAILSACAERPLSLLFWSCLAAVRYSFWKAMRSTPVMVVARPGSWSAAGDETSSAKGISSEPRERDRNVRCMAGRGAAVVGCWIVVVWYKNGRSVLDVGARGREHARSVVEQIDIDKKKRKHFRPSARQTAHGIRQREGRWQLLSSQLDLVQNFWTLGRLCVNCRIR